MKAILRVTAALLFGVAIVIGGIVLLTHRDRKFCFESAVGVCGAGITGTVEYAGPFGFGSSCTITCGEEEGTITFADRTWPFGKDR